MIYLKRIPLVFRFTINRVIEVANPRVGARLVAQDTR